jgi:hypothetical protein
MHATLPKGPNNQFKAVQQSRQQELKGYCSNSYYVAIVVLLQTRLELVQDLNFMLGLITYFNINHFTDVGFTSFFKYFIS